MKKILMFFLAATAFTACSYDDGDLWNRIDDIESRLGKLEKAATDANSDISALQGVVSALQNNVTVSSVVPTPGGDGHIITFSNGETATLTSGRDGENAPVISVKKDDDGIYYWTADGDWLEADGEKVKAAGTDGADAAVPEIRINTDTEEWEISADGGKTWTSMGPATGGSSGDYLFSAVEVKDGYLIVTLSDDTEIKLPMAEGFSFVIDGASAGTVQVKYGMTKALAVQASGVADYTVVAKPGGWGVVYSENDGLLNITAPAAGNPSADAEGGIAILVISQTGMSMLAKVKVEAVENYTHTITFEGDYWEPFVAANRIPGAYSTTSGFGSGYPLWVDATTQLTTEYPAGQGYDYTWIVSSYNSNSLNTATYADYTHDLYVYNPDNADSTTGGGRNGSDNFLVSYGYKDLGPWAWGDFRPVFKFRDGVARTIESVHVNSTNYFLGVVAEGNGLSPALAPGEDVTLIATGYDADGNQISEVTMEYATYENVISEWTEWNLSGLGNVVMVRINMTGGTDNGYGFSLPAYYAIDDITVVID